MLVMKKIYLLILAAFAGIAAWSQVTMPLNFETGTFTFTNFDGGNATVIDNPQKTGINTSNKVGQMVKGPGGAPWGGAFIDLTSPIDFDAGKTIRVKVYSPRAASKFLFKVENRTNPGSQFHEVEVSTTLVNQWEDLTINFSGVNTAFSYDRVVVIFERGTVGEGGAGFTFLFDDLRQEGGLPPSTVPILPLDFESNTLEYTFVNFDGGAATVIDNPQKTGINTSNRVARLVKNAGAVWAGSLIQLRNPIDFTTNKSFKVKVYSPRAGARLLLKVENKSDGGISFQDEKQTTQANAWEELTFNFGGINVANQYQNVVFIFDNGTVGDGTANFTFLVDDVRLVAGSTGNPAVAPNVPAPTPPARNPSDVISLFSDAYTPAVTMVRADWSPGGNLVNNITVGTDNVLELTINGGPFHGFQLGGPLNLTQMQFMHIDLWISGNTRVGAVFNPKLSQHGGGHNTGETAGLVSTNPIAQGEEGKWISFDLPLSSFSGGGNPRNIISQLVFNHDNLTTNNPIYFDNVYFYTGTPLPVRLVSFTAEKQQQTVVLNWATASETNNKLFAVERSTDADKWVDIATLQGSGNSSSLLRYTATDLLPAPGLNYYRLRQQDLDGTTTYSSIKVVDFSGTGLANLKVYPNPAKGKLQVIANSFAQKGTYTIYNMQGRQVQSGQFEQLLAPMAISLDKLSAGQYILVLRDADKSSTSRFMVQ